jgi:hypothetical protein
MDWLKTIFGGDGGVGGVVKSVGDAVGQFVEKPEDRLKVQQALADAEMAVKRLAFDAELAYHKDRESARDLYKTDSGLQKLYAMTFLIAYIGLTVVILAMLVAVGFYSISLPEWATLLIGSIFGAMSTKVSTITDFFFGSSQGSRDKDQATVEAMRKIPSTP